MRLSLETIITLPLLASVGLALNAPKRDSPDPNQCFKFVGFWGQNSVSLGFPNRQDWEKPLAEYCRQGNFDELILSFLISFNPATLNFAYHCETTPFPQNPFLLGCPDIGRDIKVCQSLGKKLLLSMGGGASNGVFTSEQQGRDFADTVWKMFMGGSDPNIPRPFGDAKIDGIDLDIEGGSPVGYGSFSVRLRELYATDESKYYYLAASPQCPYPDAYMGPQPTPSIYNGYALTNGSFDYINIQFYNNFCGLNRYELGAANQPFFNFETWNRWAEETKTPLFPGFPGSAFSAGSGYTEAGRLKQILGELIDRYGPQRGGWFSGAMTWDAGSATANVNNGVSLASDIASFLRSRSPSGACSVKTNTMRPSTSTRSSTTTRPMSSTRTTTSMTRTSTMSASTRTTMSSSTRTSSSSSTRTTMSSSTRTSSSSAGPQPTGIIPACFCPPQDGFPETRSPGFAVKRCPDNQTGSITNVCSDLPGGSCKWGTPKENCN